MWKYEIKNHLTYSINIPTMGKNIHSFYLRNKSSNSQTRKYFIILIDSSPHTYQMRSVLFSHYVAVSHFPTNDNTCLGTSINDITCVCSYVCCGRFILHLSASSSYRLLGPEEYRTKTRYGEGQSCWRSNLHASSSIWQKTNQLLSTFR